MLLDTSAVVAILLGEPEAPAMITAISRDGTRLLGAPSLVEAAAVMNARKGPGGEVALDALLERLDIRIVPMSLAAARLARLAFARFGKGVGSPGVLNHGDCLAYGIAMAEREALLFKGDDFRHTDVASVKY
jgi:ribonuclease VapC